MALLTLVYVLATVVIVFISVKATRLSQKHLEAVVALEKSRLRPYVLFNISSSTEKRITFASVRNLGLTAAHNLKIEIRPKLFCFEKDNERECALTAYPILLLLPNEQIEDVLDTSPAFHKKYKQPFFAGTVSYEDSNGKRYLEPFKIDLRFLKKRIYPRELSIAVEIGRLNTTLEEFAKSLQVKHDESGR